MVNFSAFQAYLKITTKIFPLTVKIKMNDYGVQGYIADGGFSACK